MFVEESNADPGRGEGGIGGTGLEAGIWEGRLELECRGGHTVLCARGAGSLSARVGPGCSAPRRPSPCSSG